MNPQRRSRPDDESPAIDRDGQCFRDVTFAEDDSQIATGNAPQIMASLRNIVIAILRNADWDNLAEATRHHARDRNRPVRTLLQS